MEQVLSDLFDADVFLESPSSIIFTALHGTRRTSVGLLLQRLDIRPQFVAEQMVHDS
jgi:hypothetical protein